VRSNASDGLASRRLGIYLDDVYWVFEERGRRRISTDRSFFLFLCEVGARFDRVVMFGRTVYSDVPSEYVLPAEIELVDLPHYANLRRLFEVLGAVRGSLTGFWRGLDRVDTLWVFGPHPFALLLVALALVRRKRVFLGVRQDSVPLYRTRLPALRWRPAIVVLQGLDNLYRVLSRRLPTTVQGEELAIRYGGLRPNLLAITESVVRARDVVAAPPERDWSQQIELLTVGRLETEKNPLLLVEALARLESERPGRFRLTWVGRGPLDEAVRGRAAELGVLDRIDFRGYVPFDGGLLDLYRMAHIFVHVSLSEGMPKVILEALAAGTPIVATDVGGVKAALGGGTAALLVPPDDLEALVTAVLRVSEEAEVRGRLVRRGLELASRLTLEAQAESVARFMDRHLPRLG
jgi:glycosyltransferase involved in cell wall biosynthesis